MTSSRRNGGAVIIHGGGPTAVMNASLAGVIAESSTEGAFSTLLGSRFGLDGLLREQFIDLRRQPREVLDRLPFTTGSVLGSSRRSPSAEDLLNIIGILERWSIRYVFFNGGNGSMYAAGLLLRAACERGYEMQVIGIPKTIDNDLGGTDHAPGYGSAARFVACAVRDIGSDLSALRERVTVIETMGRNAGWLVASSALARTDPEDPPHLIYMPERPVSEDRLIDDVARVYDRLNYCVVTVCEGQMNDRGEAFGADSLRPDGFGRSLSANLGHTIAQLLSKRLKVRARSEKPGLLGRSSACFVSPIDREEALECGRAAVRAAVAGASGKMIALQREAGVEYRSRTCLIELADVAAREQRFPAQWIRDGSQVATEFLSWLWPLTGDIEGRPKLIES